MSVYGTSVVKRLSKAQARELDHHLLVIAEQEKPTSVRGMYYMAMGADLVDKDAQGKRNNYMRIQRRSRKGEVDPDEREELWKESVRRYNARRREENRLLWCDYFAHLAGSLRARAEEYDHRAQALIETDQPKGAG